MQVLDKSSFPIRFAGSLRPSQTQAIELARKELASGGRKIHIVAPPGSGKTVLGLYLWADCVRRPALVLSPNSAIQAQWAARVDLFRIDPSCTPAISTDPGSPGLLTSLTYQAVTLPRREGEDLDALALDLWQDRLIEKGQAKDPAEAIVWIEDLRRHNPDYFNDRFSAYRKEIRDEIARSGQALSTLHVSSRETLERLREHGIGLIILDECHHLMGHWGRVLSDACRMLDDPVVVGLTATPPDRDGKAPVDVRRYDEFFGPIDYETPLPAVVKDGFLAPYQDLAYFVRPTADELSYLATTDREFARVVDDLCRAEPIDSQGQQARESLPDWVLRVLAERRLPTGTVKDWTSFEHRDPEFARCGPLFLRSRGLPLPDGVPDPAPHVNPVGDSQLDRLIVVVDRYVRHHLLRSPRPTDHELAERAIARLRLLGVQITETGAQACDSPVNRVMAYSRAKTQALLAILKAESSVLGEQIRAIVVADYEKTSAVTAEIGHLLDEEAGGAIAAFRALLSDPQTDALDPVLVTGSTVLVDDDLAERFLEKCREWLGREGLSIGLSCTQQDGFHVLTGEGQAWCPRVYVRMITELFQQGVTRCLVGTRGLLGEGWDAPKVNVLVSLTAVTTSMSVNQLHGRSVRLDPDDPEKLADNWDVVCIAPEFTKGLEDYHRFTARHETIYGLTDDGAIEKGVGHVHAAFTELKPEGIEGAVEVLNMEMLARVGRRARCREQWRIGQPYHPKPIRAIEMHDLGGGKIGFPPFVRSDQPWSDKSLATAVGNAVLNALVEAGLLREHYPLRTGERAGGYVRLFIENADEADGALFAESLHEALGPLENPRYVIPRFSDDVCDTWLSKIMPEIVARYFQRRRRRMAMLHAVPSVLARNKDLAAIYARHWNQHVSPGQVVYAYQGEGERVLDQARQSGQIPQGTIRDKDIFL